MTMDPRARLAAERSLLRLREDEHEVVRAQREQAAIDAAGGHEALGPNEAARKRTLTIALADDPAHRRSLAELRLQQELVEALAVEVAQLEDERRRERNRMLDRLAAALEEGQVPNDLSRLVDRLVEPVGEALAGRLALLAPEGP
jgi:hypothetical protein